jgi:hypothetical protein
VRQLKPWHLVAAYSLGLLTFAPLPAVTLPGLPLPVIGWLFPSPAPFKADKLCVLCLEDSSAQARAKLTPNQENVLRGQADTDVRKFVESHKGEFEVLDAKNQSDIPWVKLAMAVPHGDLPCIIAASPRGGFAFAIAPDAKSGDIIKKLSSIAMN